MSGYILHLYVLHQMLEICLIHASKEYCMVDNFNPTCTEDEVIIMQEAKYGQMTLGKCIKEDLGFLGCHGDVLGLFDNLCSGKQNCDVRVGSHNMGATSTCRDGLLQYLEATYICRKALQVGHSQCSAPIPLNEEETVITSDITEHGLQNCIRLNQPFTVSAKRGQVQNITLIDFHYSTEPDHMSQTYGQIRDIGDGNDIAITAEQRMQHLAVTHGHQIEITLYTNSKQFALDIKVQGCADLSPPVGAWMTRNGDATELGCHSGKHTWTLRCVGDQWLGAVGYCGTVSGEHSFAESEVIPVKTEISRNIIVFGICSLLLLISSIIFLIGVLILRRHNKSKRSQYNYHPAAAVAVPSSKDLLMFDSGSLRQSSLHGSVMGTLPAGSGRMTVSQDYKSLQV